MAHDFAGAFVALRTILKRHSAGLNVLQDSTTNYTVLTPSIGPNGKPIYFGAVMLKKSAVTYHLFPLYFNPKLQSAVPKELLPRKQGKTCFNFKTPDAALFEKLNELTQLAREHFQNAGLCDAGDASPDKLELALRSGGTDLEALATLRKAKGKAAAKKRAATIAKKKAAAKRGR